jgi:hypothetical protein
MIVAFDTSTRRTGWIRGEPGGPVHFGSFGMTEAVQGNLGRLLTEFGEAAWPLIEGCSHVYFEAPIIPFHGNVKSLRPLWALTAHVEFLAHHAGADCAEIANNEHKQLLYGHGGAKPENAEEYAAAWGLPARNNDEADACGLFLYALKHEFPDDFQGWLAIRAQAPPITRISPPSKPRRKKGSRGKRKPGRTDPALF